MAAVNLSVYSNANAATKTISVDFVGDILASDDNHWLPSNAASLEYYFKITTGARQDNNSAFPVKTIRKLSDLALRGQKQSATDTANAYTTIKTMVVDYVYDLIHGHTSDQYSSGCSAQRPMKFTN